MDESFIEEYRVSLSDLSFNSKPHINMLTMLAEENIKHAALVVETIVAHIKEVPPESKLPGLYLVDSIMKNIAGQYITLFSKHVVSLFTSVFRKVEESTRSSLYKLRQTWDNLLPKKIMYELDCSIKKLDPAWPVTALPPASLQPASKKPKVFVNPEFFSGTMVQKAQVVAPPPALVDKRTVKRSNKGPTVLELLAEQKKKLEMKIAAAQQQKDFPEKMEMSTIPRDPRLVHYAQHQASLQVPPNTVPFTHFLISQSDKQKTISTPLSKKASPLPSNGPSQNITKQTPPIPSAVSVPNTKSDFNRTSDSNLVSNASGDASKRDRSSTPPVKIDIHVEKPNESKSTRKPNDKSLRDEVEESKDDKTSDKKRSCSPITPEGSRSPKKICMDVDQIQAVKNLSQSSDSNGPQGTHQKSFTSRKDRNRIKGKSGSGSKSCSPDTEQSISTPPLFGNADKDYRHLTRPVQSDPSHSSNVPYRDLGIVPSQDSMSVANTEQISEPKESTGIVIKTEPVDVESIKPVSAKDRLPPVAPSKPFKLDGKDRNLYFVDERAFVILDNNEPFELSFHGPPKKVFIDGYPFPINLEFDGQAVEVNINGKPNHIKFGTPTREVYINKYPYEGQFGGPPFRVLLNNDVEHFARIEGPPPKVMVSDKPAYELYEAYKRTQSVPVIEPVKCVEGKTAMADVDMRLKPTLVSAASRDASKDMDWRQSGVVPPMEMCIGSYMTSVIPAPSTLWQGPLNIPVKSEPLSISNPSTSLGIRMSTMLPPLPLTLVPIKVEKPGPPIPILDQLKQLNKMAPITPNMIGSQNVRSKGPWTPLPPPPPFPGSSTIATNPTVAAPVVPDPPAPVNVESIFKKLVAAGIIPKVKEEPKSPEPENSDDKDKSSSEEQNLAIFEQPIPKIKLKPKQLKNFYPGVIGALYRGSQCATCGMRFKEIQSEQYSRHLDWHFRMNRREKDGVKKAFSRRLYYRIEDWSDFKEIEEAEERAPSYFELQAVGESLNNEEHEKISSVPASECENERCSVCGEQFQLFWVEEDEEWHLRNAVRHDEEAYHPACYEDFKKAEELEKAKEELEKAKEESAESAAESDDKANISDVEIKVEIPDAEEPMEQESEETSSATEDVKIKVEKEEEDKDTTDENETDKDKSEAEEEEKSKDQTSEVERTSGGESDSDEEPEFRPPTPDPRFQILPPVQKGTELSALCVIM